MDTLVSTENGLRPIEEIQAGDYVWSENTETGKKELKKVLSVSVTETTTLVHVTTENGTVVDTTENHPFYVEGKGWCAAAELEAGDVLRTEDGERETVKSVQTEKLDKAVKVYNLEIEDSHTYYVSADRVLVHNACRGGKFSDVDAGKGVEEVAHHMPQNAYNAKNDVSRGKGPALLMSKIDHALTRTFAGRGKKTMRTDDGLTAMQRLELDIQDIRELFGSKYDEGIAELLAYAKTLPEYND